MSIYIFLGPTVGIDEARAILGARYLPPVAMGDVASLMENETPRAIGIIDGYFEQRPAVWHKEILYALSKGIRVYGSSSMGALRAAELHPYGMIGVGKIFEAYVSGELEADDEVAVSHASAEMGYRALSDALVNIRDALEKAELAQLISRQTRNSILEYAKGLFFPERTWASIWDGVKSRVPAAELDALRIFVTREKPNLKRSDALLLLERMAKDDATGAVYPPPDFDFEPTFFWERIPRTPRRLDCDQQDGLSDDDVVRYARVVSADTREISRSALLLKLIDLEA